MNQVCSNDYSIQTKNSMAQLSEREVCFEVVEVSSDNSLIFIYFLSTSIVPTRESL